MADAKVLPGAEFVALADAAPETCGAKAATLGRLRRAGFQVPDGFVVPFGALPGRAALARALADLGDPPVAVRSSASDEDTPGTSAAGQYDSFLAVRGVDEVLVAVRRCQESAVSPRAVAYRRGSRRPGIDPDPGAAVPPARRPTEMAVLVQRLVDADASGVMFTPSRPGDPTVIEAAWGLGADVVGGTVTPDRFLVSADADGRRAVSRTVTGKPARRDRGPRGTVVTQVPAGLRRVPSLDDDTARRLAALGQEVSDLLGGPQDIEWALADGELHLLQARPVTVAAPRAALTSPAPGTAPPTAPAALTAPAPCLSRLAGTAGSGGRAEGPARIVRGPDDFARVRPGDILVCPFTDPSWTPLLGVVAGVVTEIGGLLSHAAIVARERGIPAVLGVRDATSALPDGVVVTLDGDAGTVTTDRPAAGHATAGQEG